MQNRLWQLLVLGSLFSSQLTVQSLAEELPGKPENKTKGIPYAAHPEVAGHHPGVHHVLKLKDSPGTRRVTLKEKDSLHQTHTLQPKHGAGDSKSDDSGSNKPQ
jgi:hypothetical protein